MRKPKKMVFKREAYLPNIICDALDNGSTTLNYCCGIHEIGAFSSDVLSDAEDAIIRFNEDLDSYVAGENEEFPEYIDIEPISVREAQQELNQIKAGLILATTTQRQREPAEALALVGFQVVQVCKSPSTGNTITLWAYRPSGRSKRGRE